MILVTPSWGGGHRRADNQEAQTERAQKTLQAVNIDRELSKTRAPAKIRTTIDLVRRLIKLKKNLRISMFCQT